ncbi:MAG: lipoyl(octanoyl) transferase LipB [Candidatus Omnitrophica bacterium]|nr:lipoyl(octanoyl) transferase LipB [Candidatus Omnitrophota bacterium]
MDFRILDLGLIDYKSAWELQKETLRQVKDGRLNAALLVCSHYPVITLGRPACSAGKQAERKNILISESELNLRGIKIYEVERGGDVTYHGPGQLTAYPVFNLEFLRKDIHWFLRQLEGIITGCLSQFGIDMHIRQGLTGVWAGKFKIASIGIAVKNWITFHGLSINLRKDDLANFNFIRPCGMEVRMAALENFCDKEINICRVKEDLISEFRNFYLLNYRPFKEAEVMYA